MSPISPNGKIKEQCHPEWGTRLGWGRRLETTTLLSFPPFPPPNPQIKNEYCSAGALPSGRPLSVAQVCKAFLGPASSPLHCSSPAARWEPAPRSSRSSLERGMGGRGVGSPIPYSSPRSNTGPFPPSSPSCQPIAKALKRNQAVSGRRGVGAVQMLGRGRLRRQGETGGCGRTKPQPSPTACSYLGSALPWFLCPDRARLPALDAGAASSLALLLPRRGPVPCRQQKSPHSTHPNYFCPFGSWPWRSGDWWQ